MHIEATIDGDVTKQDVQNALSELDADVSIREVTPLSEEQRKQVRSTAIDVVYEDLKADHYSLMDLAEKVVDAETTHLQAELIHQDPERQREILGFDPETGEVV